MKAKKARKHNIEAEKKPTQGIAIASLILNVLVLPGLGTIIAGRTNIGVWQLVLAIISIPLIFILIGIPILIAVWIWGLVTSIKLIQQSEE